MSARTRVLFLLACGIGLLDIALAAVGITPVTPKVTESQYDLIFTADPGEGTTPANATEGSFLSGSFRLAIPQRIRGQRISVSRVVFFSQEGKRLGSVRVSQLRMTGSDGSSGGSLSDGTIVLPPLRKAEVSFRAISQNNLGVTPGLKIYSQVEGRAGMTSFRARSPVSAASGQST